MNTKQFIKHFITPTLCAVVLAASLPVHAEDAGFLPDYSRLTADPDRPDTKIWISEEAQFSRYKSFMIDPVVSKLSPELIKKGARPDAKLLNEVTRYMHEALVREYSKYWPVVEQAGDGVLRLRTAITGVNTAGGLNSPVDYLPFMLVAKTVSGGASKKAYVHMEGYYSDSVTGELIWELTQAATGKKAKDEVSIKLDDTKDVIDKWAMQAAKNTKNKFKN
jgi:hypothetical protein